MTTFKAVVGTRKKDGTFNVKIRLTKDGVVKYISTDIFVEKFQLKKNGDIKDPDVTDIVTTRYIRRFRDIIASVECSESYSAEELKGIIVDRIKYDKRFKLDFFEYAESNILHMKYNTRTCYTAMLSALERFVGERKLDINDISHQFVMKFRAHLENEPRMTGGSVGKTYDIGGTKKGGRAVSMYLSRMRHIHNLARSEFNDDDIGNIMIPREPFKKGVIPPQPVTKHRAITPEQIRLVASAMTSTRRSELARDVFVLSFALLGMNSADLYRCKKCNVKGDMITYNRAKTESRRSDHAEITIRIEDYARVIIDKYKDSSKRDSYFVFSNMYSDEKNFNKALNAGLKELCSSFETNGIDMPLLTFYHARHSWATIARNYCGIGKDVVAEALNHASVDKVTDIYIERSFSHIWDANKKVLDFVFENKSAS